MSYELSGQVIKKFEIETFASGFQKQNIVVKTEDQYPQEIQIEFTQNKIDLIENINAGDHVTVSFNVNGRSWTSPQGETKYFNSIVGWKILTTGNSYNETATAEVPKPKYEPVINDSAQDTGELFDDDDDLPF